MVALPVWFAAMPLPMLPRPINATRAILLALPIGRTLVDESGHAFFLVFGSEETVEQAALIGDALRQRHFEGGVDLLLGRHRGERRHRRDRPGGFHRLIEKLVSCNTARTEARALGLCRAHHAAGKAHLHRLRLADGPG